ncbi:hypothetical protein GCM10010441_20310 [Kitasatospora paracochleata]
MDMSTVRVAEAMVAVVRSSRARVPARSVQAGSPQQPGVCTSQPAGRVGGRGVDAVAVGALPDRPVEAGGDLAEGLLDGVQVRGGGGGGRGRAGGGGGGRGRGKGAERGEGGQQGEGGGTGAGVTAHRFPRGLRGQTL